MTIDPESRLPALAALALIGAALLGLLRGSGAAGQSPVERLNVPTPELVGGPWLNVPGSRPNHLAEQCGKVGVLHF